MRQTNYFKNFFLLLLGGVILTRGEVSYKSDLEVAKSVMKRGKLISTMKPRILPTGNISIKSAKLNDVSSLLKKHYGDGWENIETLTFYKNIVNTVSSNTEDTAGEQFCEFQEEDTGLRI